MENENIIVVKSKAFAIRIVRMYKHLKITKREYILSQQVLRSGTSIGANVHEAIQAQSKADFKAKMYIALKEASETEYWLELLRDTDYLKPKEAESILTDCIELIKLLTKITKTVKENS
ncbi:MAG: four helix bundle protein [Selenomonadaceae bacterium]|nr:four helix bundle protein [Selenomonadaceae bacterium]